MLAHSSYPVAHRSAALTLAGWTIAATIVAAGLLSVIVIAVAFGAMHQERSSLLERLHDLDRGAERPAEIAAQRGPALTSRAVECGDDRAARPSRGDRA